MLQTQVLIIGGGPIGLTGGLLLSKLGIKSVVVDKRGRTSTHPRSRFVDVCTLELMRELGLDEKIVATGLGPDWTQFNRWLDGLAKTEHARISSPSFYSVQRDISPTIPVMTAQDEVEAILFDAAEKDPNIDLRFNTLAFDLTQDDAQVTATLETLDSGQKTIVSAPYAIGADGVRSTTRDAIGCPLDADEMDVFFQDIIFDADFSKYVEGRKGGLLFIAHDMGPGLFQPLDGKRRWRCQIGNFPRDKKMTPEFATQWIRSAVGAGDDVPIQVKTMTEWQFMPGRTKAFRNGRVFLAGDAAHVFIPTGGLGNNTGFFGIRNLAWKLAYVIKGASPPTILDTYDEELRPVAEKRIAVGRRNAELAAPIFYAIYGNESVSDAERNCRQYADYDGVILGYELSSDLCARDPSPAPDVENAISDFVPVVRSGRRAPHSWVDEAQKKSVFDWFGTDYQLLAGANVDITPWQDRALGLADKGFPIRLRRLPQFKGQTPYDDNELVLVRPDGVIADHWGPTMDLAGQEMERLTRALPTVH